MVDQHFQYMKKKYAKHGEKWTKVDDERLVKMFNVQGTLDIKETAKMFQRCPSAIISRMEFLGCKFKLTASKTQKMVQTQIFDVNKIGLDDLKVLNPEDHRVLMAQTKTHHADPSPEFKQKVEYALRQWCNLLPDEEIPLKQKERWNAMMDVVCDEIHAQSGHTVPANVITALLLNVEPEMLSAPFIEVEILYFNKKDHTARVIVYDERFKEETMEIFELDSTGRANISHISEWFHKHGKKDDTSARSRKLLNRIKAVYGSRRADMHPKNDLTS